MAADEAQQLASTKPRRPLSLRVDLIVDGTIPWGLEADHGWTLAASSKPMNAPMPDHLVAALGGPWTVPTTAGGAR